MSPALQEKMIEPLKDAFSYMMVGMLGTSMMLPNTEIPENYRFFPAGVGLLVALQIHGNTSDDLLYINTTPELQRANWIYRVIELIMFATEIWAIKTQSPLTVIPGLLLASYLMLYTDHIINKNNKNGPNQANPEQATSIDSGILSYVNRIAL